MNEDLTPRLHDAMQRAAVRDIGNTLFIVILAIATIYYFINPHVKTIWFDVWAISSVVVQVVRLVQLKSYKDKQLTVTMRRLVIMSQAVGGFCWAALLVFWHHDMSIAHQLMFVLGPIGVGLGSVTSAGAWPSFSITTILSSKVPFLFYAAISQAEGLLTLMVPMALFIVMDLTLLKNYHRRIKESFALRIHNQSLIQHLTDKNAHLKEAEQRALQAANAKSDFLARMSHELRTPINGVIGSADMLSRTELDEKQDTWLSTIQRSSDDMLRLVSQLLDHARINDGQVSLDAREFDVRQCIDSCVERKLDDNPYAAIHLVVSDDVPEQLLADSFRLTQVLEHLVDNAHKFSDNRQVNILIDVIENPLLGVQDEAVPSSLRIAVSDDGIGIPEDKLDTIFADLEQLDGSMSRRYGGSGLGLTLAQQLVTLMGGELLVQSEEGRGSTFTIQIPMTVVEQVASVETGAEERGNLTGLNVLVAEDNMVNQVVLESMLEELGCQVTLADDGIEALTAMTEANFDMVFMDCQMPGMDGLEATTAARDKGVAVPIVAVTANALSGDRERCIDAGMDDYLAKPVTQSHVAEMLHRWSFGSAEPVMAAGA